MFYETRNKKQKQKNTSLSGQFEIQISKS